MSEAKRDALFKQIRSRAEEEGELSDAAQQIDLRSLAQESSAATECCTVEDTGQACICSSGEFALFCDIEEWY